MTTLNTIIEEEKKEAKQKWEEIVTFCQKRKDGPSVLMHENFLDDTLTTAIQRAYEAGGREADAKWEREVEGVYKHRGNIPMPAEVTTDMYRIGFNEGWNSAVDVAVKEDLLSKIRSTPTTNHTGETNP